MVSVVFQCGWTFWCDFQSHILIVSPQESRGSNLKMSMTPQTFGFKYKNIPHLGPYVRNILSTLNQMSKWKVQHTLCMYLTYSLVNRA